MSEVLTDDWFKCYGQAWGNLCVPAAVAHPAKFSRKLIFRIFEHAIEEGWVKPGDTCIDMFGGVALGALPAMMNGLHWRGVELEARFCALAQDNIDLWNSRYAEQMPNWGTAVIVQGDSRRLGEVLARAQICLSSPPYSTGGLGTRSKAWFEREASGDYPKIGVSNFHQGGYGDNTDGQLAVMPDTGFEAALAEPVHTVAPKMPVDAAETPQDTERASHGIPSEAQEGTGQPVLALSSPVYIGNTASDDPDKRGGLYRDPKRRNDKTLTATYSEDAAQLAQMPEGNLALALGSPPYVGSLGDGKSGIDWSKQADRETAHPHGWDGDGYGAEPGQLAALPEGDHAAACERPAIAISSPPYEGIRQDGGGEYAKAGMGGIRPYTDEPVDTWFTQRDQRNLGNMRPGDHAEALEAGAVTPACADRGQAQCAISSPPWEKSEGSMTRNFSEWHDEQVRLGKMKANTRGAQATPQNGYGTTAGQLGQETGSTFWAASREILEQVYQVLAPGAHAIFVCKRFVRSKKIVEFPTQWAHLCEAVGFTWIHHHKAWLVEDRGAQHTLEGGLETRTVKRFSFFKRLHAQKYPELEISWEDVLCFVKPLMEKPQ